MALSFQDLLILKLLTCLHSPQPGPQPWTIKGISFTQSFPTKFTTIIGQNCQVLPLSWIHFAASRGKTDDNKCQPHSCKSKIYINYGGIGAALIKKAIDQCYSFMKFYQFSMNKCFSICCLPLLYFQSLKMIVLVNLVQIFAKRISPASLYHHDLKSLIVPMRFAIDMLSFSSLTLTDIMRSLKTMGHDPEHDSKLSDWPVWIFDLCW